MMSYVAKATLILVLIPMFEMGSMYTDNEVAVCTSSHK